MSDQNPLSWPDDRWLTRIEASAYTRALGLRMAVSTLAKHAWRGDGPPMKKMRRRCYYNLADFRRWLSDRLD